MIMNKVLGSICFCLFLLGFPGFFSEASAQKKNAPSLEVILSDNHPLQISINGRTFKKINRKLYLRDLPARRNQIEIVRVCEKGEDNCQNQVVFSGEVKFQKGKHYQAVVLVGEEKLRVADDGTLFQPENVYNPSSNINPSGAQAQTEFLKSVEVKQQLPDDITALGERMKKLEKDTYKVNAASSFVKSRREKVNTDQLQAISSWILFDENKLEFLKNAYPYVSNPAQYGDLALVFTMTEYSEQLKAFIAEQ